MILTLLLVCLLGARSSMVKAASGWTCPAGKAAVNDLLPSDDDGVQVDSKPLSIYGFELYISNEYIDPNRQTVLQAGFNYVIRIKVTKDRFRGAFIRLESLSNISTYDALRPRDTKMQVDTSCVNPVIGIGTVDFYPKPGVTGILRLDEAATVTLDVTIIKTITGSHLSYAYSQYNITFIHDMPSTSVPSLSPTLQPTHEPTSSTFCSADQVQQCQASNLTSQESDTCNSCITNAISKQVSNCSQLEATVCAAFTNCSCGACSTYLEAYFSCAYRDLLGCNIVCSSSQAAATTTALDEFTFTT
jgi:hypothetical protein